MENLEEIISQIIKLMEQQAVFGKEMFTAIKALHIMVQINDYKAFTRDLFTLGLVFTLAGFFQNDIRLTTIALLLAVASMIGSLRFALKVPGLIDKLKEYVKS